MVMVYKNKVLTKPKMADPIILAKVRDKIIFFKKMSHLISSHCL